MFQACSPIRLLNVAYVYVKFVTFKSRGIFACFTFCCLVYSRLLRAATPQLIL